MPYLLQYDECTDSYNQELELSHVITNIYLIILLLVLLVFTLMIIYQIGINFLLHGPEAIYLFMDASEEKTISTS